MSEIEKMYMRCKIKKQQTCRHSDTCYDGSLDNCEGCNSYQYPQFTAEKQLELIKWLARKGLIQINYSSHQCYQFNSFRVGGDYKTDISEALASHCNNLWQDLTEEEKQQIRKILE